MDKLVKFTGRHMPTAENIVNAAVFITHAVQGITAVSAAYMKVARLSYPLTIAALIRVFRAVRHTVEHRGASVKVLSCNAVHCLVFRGLGFGISVSDGDTGEQMFIAHVL